jgi:hypothetical protein
MSNPFISKDTELSVMRDTIQRLGPGSYLGPFLQSQIPFMEHALRSDMPPTPLNEAHALANRIVTDAETIAKEKIENAQKEAERIVAEARDERDRVKTNLLACIHRTISTLQV